MSFLFENLTLNHPNKFKVSEYLWKFSLSEVLVFALYFSNSFMKLRVFRVLNFDSSVEAHNIKELKHKASHSNF